MDRLAQRSTVSLSYVLFYEEGEEELGPHLVQQKQGSE